MARREEKVENCLHIWHVALWVMVLRSELWRMDVKSVAEPSVLPYKAYVSLNE